jgi:predicted metal-dependent phosphoesterase TrpH
VTAPDGWTRVDTHVKTLDDRVVARAKERDIDVLVYAPHFARLPTVRRRAAAHSDDDLLVVPGREVLTGGWRDRRHVLALGLQSPVPDFVTFAGAMAEFDRQNAVVVVPHPERPGVGVTEAEVARYRETIDAVETYVPTRPRRNRRAREVARSLDLPRTGASHAHRPRTVGAAWTAVPDPVEDETDLIAALRDPVDPADRGGRRVAHRSGPDHHVERVVEMCQLAVEHSWGVLDRRFLSGTEPTHPGHVVYEGRFDDVAVY